MNPKHDLIHRMQAQSQAWGQTGDRRAVFLECYTLMTGNMLGAIEASRFHDGEWAGRLLLRFAAYYFQALEAYDQKDIPCTQVWRFAHDCACEGKLHVLQHLLLGINAHINYDLVLSLVDLLDQEWEGLSPDQRRHRYEDHCLVNEVIAATIDTVQDTVVERYDPRLDWVDRLLGRLDERLLSALISRWRQEVWEEALRFLETPPEEREELRRAMEARVLKRARQIAF